MKILAEFTGRVKKLNAPPEVSYVTLKELATGKLVETDAVSEKLIEKGIGEGDQFSVTVQESLDGKIDAVLKKLDSSVITSEGDFTI